MKKLLLLLTLISAPCFAQDTISVIGTIVDSDAQPWAYASWNATIVVPGGGKAVYLDTGQPVPNYSGTATSTGGLTGTIGRNSKIVPAGTMWRFTVTPATSSGPEVLPTVSINTGFNAGTYISAHITAPRIPASTLVYAYNATEITTPVNGSGYINTYTGGCYYRQGNAWGGCGATITTSNCNNNGVVYSAQFSGVLACDPYFLWQGDGNYQLNDSLGHEGQIEATYTYLGSIEGNPVALSQIEGVEGSGNGEYGVISVGNDLTYQTGYIEGYYGELHTSNAGTPQGTPSGTGLLASGAYYNGTQWILTNTYASLIQSIPTSGEANIIFYYALGTIGSVASFTQAGEIDASGNWYSGTTEGFTGTKTAGLCTITFKGGLVTAVSGC